MIVDEGMAKRNGEHLAVQYLKQAMKNCRGEAPGTVNNYHYHKYIELFYLEEGEVNAYIGDKVYPLFPGEIAIVFPGEPHTFCTAKDGDRINYVAKMLPDILVTKEQTGTEFEYYMNLKTPAHSRVIKATDEMAEIFRSSVCRFDGADYADELIIRADTIKLSALILAEWNRRGEIMSFFGGAKKDNVDMLKKLMDISEAKKGCIKTHEAAKFCNLSDGYFIRFFKSVMNMSFSEYTRGLKTREAQRLLKCTDKSVTEIAQMLDYATSSHFIKDFKKEKNMSPGKYRSGQKSLEKGTNF